MGVLKPAVHYKHYINGHLHRDGDIPAIYHIKNRYETYYKFGLLHRDGGKPAVIHINSVDEYYKFGIRDFSKSYQ